MDIWIWYFVIFLFLDFNFDFKIYFLMIDVGDELLDLPFWTAELSAKGLVECFFFFNR